MLVVYLSNRYIRVVAGEKTGGKVRASGLYYSVDTQGCILNGSVMDEEGFLGIIKDLWESNGLARKGIHLVIDSTQFTSRVLDVPLQKPAQTMQFLSREFTDVGRISNPVYGYFPLPRQREHKAKAHTVFATVVSREFISGYQELFGKLGITVDSVECASGAMIRLLGILSQVNDANAIVQFVDDMTLVNVLLIEGRYEYSSHNRLFADPGTQAFCAEAARAAGNILQFAKAQKIPQKITTVYIAGISREEQEFYLQNISQIDPTLEVEELSGGTDVTITSVMGRDRTFSNFSLAVGGLIETDARTNIMSQMKVNARRTEERRRRNRRLIPAVTAGAILCVITAAFGAYTLLLSMELQKEQEYNNSPDVLAACSEYEALNQEISAIAGLSQSLTGLRQSVLAYPMVNSAVEETIAGCASGLVSAEISSYDSKSGVISFDTSAGNVEQINQFIRLLSEQDIFAAVDYTGYAQDAQGQWQVKVNCTMADRQEG